MRSLLGFPFVLVVSGLLAWNQSSCLTAAPVRGMEAFQGSAAARRLLEQNGFVVADPTFKQIFEPYIQSPSIHRDEGSPEDEQDPKLPVFITTDSAWHTYHFLLEAAVRRAEERQADLLLKFSRRLRELLGTQRWVGGVELEALKSYAAVGLALQDPAFRYKAPAESKRLAELLQSGAGLRDFAIGFPLSGDGFRPQSFYADSNVLSAYFAARH